MPESEFIAAAAAAQRKREGKAEVDENPYKEECRSFSGLTDLHGWQYLRVRDKGWLYRGYVGHSTLPKITLTRQLALTYVRRLWAAVIFAAVAVAGFLLTHAFMYRRFENPASRCQTMEGRMVREDNSTAFPTVMEGARFKFRVCSSSSSAGERELVPFLAEIGGLLSLCLGASVITVFQVGYHVCRIVDIAARDLCREVRAGLVLVPKYRTA